MIYLIDGHNLIAQLPHIELEDPHDEVKLILLLRRWASASKRRRVRLFFDGGLPGGAAPGLSTEDVKVFFASSGKTADALLIGRIARAKNAAAYTLVSGDRQIIRAAKARRMPVLSATAFSRRLLADLKLRQASAPADPVVSAAEVEEWLAVFGDIIMRPPPPAPPPPPPDVNQDPAESTTPTADTPAAVAGEPLLSATEVEAWLALFGGDDTAI